ncbi:uncharacterized protein LOC131632050 [Vicia villosa]|uniref:uncharacterized protein LOC131632050 n=1 Tax=Vicia villosa TaxID=3911 RepID=UPI00273CD24A|nr:uncharacterized protein LOC131632050 [Vicia villosa]
MTKRGGKSKVLAPGKLQEQRNRIINKKPIVRKPVHTAVPAKTASAAPTQTTSPTPTQIASSAPKPALPTSSLQAASVAHTASVQNVVPTPASVHAVTSEFRFMPTPSLIHQTMAGPQSFNPQTTTGVSNSVEEDDEEEDVDDYEDEDDEVGQENVSPLVPTLDENGKVIIKPSGTGLAPAKEVAGAINYAIRKQFFKPIHHWSELDPLTKAKWFKLFAEKVSWDPCDHAFVYNAFERKGRKRLNDMMGKARKKKTRPPWIGEEAWLGLQDHWNTPEFLAVSSQNKTNRASERGGAVHTSGRKAHIDIALELSHELQRDLRPDELFLKTHKRKNGEWVDKRAASTYVSSR